MTLASCSTPAPLAAEITLRHREGSCRDVAVLFCAACRALGIAARFVSGYERDASLQENGDLHAASDPLFASPVSGTYRGSASAQLEFSISMQVE